MSKSKRRITACIIAMCMTGMSVPMTSLPCAMVASAASETLTENLKLTEDKIISGDFVMEKGTLELNGHTLTIEGNFTQKAGTVVVGKGTLNVGGDYYVFNKPSSTYGSGVLIMEDADGKVNVDGDFTLWSNNISTLTRGVLTVGGDFEGSKGNGTGGFDSYNEHTVCFKGDVVHKIYFKTHRLNRITNRFYSRINLFGCRSIIYFI